MTIEELKLSPVAEKAASQLKAQHPEVEFASGRRSLDAQASAMAANVVKSGHRDWIARTYAASDVSRALQRWLDTHPHVGTLNEIKAGFMVVLNALSPAQVSKLSKHLSGDAFDIRPIPSPQGEAVKAEIRRLPGLTRFLDHEGGLIRWHCQF